LLPRAGLLFFVTDVHKPAVRIDAGMKNPGVSAGALRNALAYIQPAIPTVTVHQVFEQTMPFGWI
jgi:hypothetical protein